VLPLRHPRPAPTRAFSAHLPGRVPYWFGVSTLERLSLGTIRYLATDSSPNTQPAPRLVASEPTGVSATASSSTTRRGLTIPAATSVQTHAH